MKQRRSHGSGFKRAQPIARSLVAVMFAVLGGAVLSLFTESALSRRPQAEGFPDARPEAYNSQKMALQAPAAHFLPTADRQPLGSSKAAPLPHDSSFISFKSSTVHASALQSLIAIPVRRTPASRGRGAFVWRVERGTALPAIDYERSGPQRGSFIEGQTVRTLFIPLLGDPTSRVRLRPRYFHVVLQRVADGPALGRFARITVIIDPTPTLWVAKSEPRNSALR